MKKAKVVWQTLGALSIGGGFWAVTVVADAKTVGVVFLSSMLTVGWCGLVYWGTRK